MHEWQVWLVASLLLFVAEMLAPGFWLLSVAVGCLAAGRQPEQCPPEESAAATQLTLRMVEARNKQGERISCRD